MIISEQKHAILTTLYLASAKNTDRFTSRLRPKMVCWKQEMNVGVIMGIQAMSIVMK
jgi:hypothetical protein